MTDLTDLKRRMAQAVEDEDFEAAAALRDQIAALESDSLFKRQVPGAMGLGTDQGVYTPPPGWQPPKKPDPMTRGRKGRGGKSGG